jgi:hypothetical protein
MQADVSLISAAAENSYSIARLLGAFYNDGTPGTGQTGEIFAEIQLVKGTNIDPQARIVAGRCNDPDCISYTNFTNQSLGNIIIGAPYRLSIAWNGSLFTFGFNNTIRTFDPKPYARIMGPPKTPYKGLNVSKHKRIGGILNRDGTGSILASFDNVYANGVFYDNFSSNRIDPNRWSYLELVREIQNGQLVSKLAAVDSTWTNALPFQDPDTINSIQADVAVNSFETVNANTRARLVGRFYNDATPGGGDITSEIRIGGSGPTPKLEYSIWRCNNTDCTSTTSLYNGSFGDAIFGVSYNLYIGWDGNFFTFKVNNSSQVVDPRSKAPVRSEYPGTPYKALETRITNLGGGSGSISVIFDNVYINSTP